MKDADIKVLKVSGVDWAGNELKIKDEQGNLIIDLSPLPQYIAVPAR
ncbi:MAG: hypothetical protein IPN68_07200 [Bacteroidetes bacterium]|nr:hypothetical protein [Bacteroidota bacterium]